MKQVYLPVIINFLKSISSSSNSFINIETTNAFKNTPVWLDRLYSLMYERIMENKLIPFKNNDDYVVKIPISDGKENVNIKIKISKEKMKNTFGLDSEHIKVHKIVAKNIFSRSDITSKKRIEKFEEKLLKTHNVTKNSLESLKSDVDKELYEKIPEDIEKIIKESNYLTNIEGSIECNILDINGSAKDKVVVYDTNIDSNNSRRYNIIFITIMDDNANGITGGPFTTMSQKNIAHRNEKKEEITLGDKKYIKEQKSYYYKIIDDDSNEFNMAMKALLNDDDACFNNQWNHPLKSNKINFKKLLGENFEMENMNLVQLFAILYYIDKFKPIVNQPSSVVSFTNKIQNDSTCTGNEYPVIDNSNVQECKTVSFKGKTTSNIENPIPTNTFSINQGYFSPMDIEDNTITKCHQKEREINQKNNFQTAGMSLFNYIPIHTMGIDLDNEFNFIINLINKFFIEHLRIYVNEHFFNQQVHNPLDEIMVELYNKKFVIELYIEKMQFKIKPSIFNSMKNPECLLLNKDILQLLNKDILKVIYIKGLIGLMEHFEITYYNHEKFKRYIHRDIQFLWKKYNDIFKLITL